MAQLLAQRVRQWYHARHEIATPQALRLTQCGTDGNSNAETSLTFTRGLRAHCIELPWGIEEGAGSRRVMFRDPAGNLIELAEEGFDSPFEQRVACMISIRTYDEVMLPTARRFFARPHTAGGEPAHTGGNRYADCRQFIS